MLLLLYCVLLFFLLPRVSPKFFSKVFPLRGRSIALQTLDFERVGSIEPHLLKRLMNHAFACNVQPFGMPVKGDICHILPGISSCRTLTSLKLSVSPKGCHNYGRMMFPKSLDLPDLTSSHLGNLAFCANKNKQNRILFVFFTS